MLGLAGGIHSVQEYCDILNKHLTPLVFKVNSLLIIVYIQRADNKIGLQTYTTEYIADNINCNIIHFRKSITLCKTSEDYTKI